VSRAFDRVWEQFIPFLAFPPEVRRMIYTTNSIESLNYQMRKFIKTRGQLPNDTAEVKLLWRAISDAPPSEPRNAARSAAEQPPDDSWKDW
jgi:transposase-like protein